MTKEEFTSKVVAGVSEKLPECEVEVRDVPKNNGMTLTGLVIRNDESNLAPTIYLEYYYEMYKDGADLSSICDAVIDKYKQFAVAESFDVNSFTKWEYVKDKICYKLINFKRNRELLAEIPHLLYLDLAVVFYCPVNVPNVVEGFSSILIRNSHLDLWGKKMEDLFEVASENTPKIMEARLEDYANVATAQVLQAFPDINDDELEEVRKENEGISLLSNKARVLGASVILYKDVLKNIAEKIGKNLIIVPRSVHDVLIMPLTPETDTDNINGLIEYVNTFGNSQDDILSDHYYYYDREDNYVFYDLSEEELKAKNYIA